MLALQTGLLVACGGAIGAVLRYFSGVAAVVLFGAGFPVGTLFVNVSGSLAMGCLAAMLLERTADPRISAFLLTGLLGGFTTFSAFSLETVGLIRDARLVAAFSYVAASVVLSVAMFIIGTWLGRSWIA